MISQSHKNNNRLKKNITYSISKNYKETQYNRVIDESLINYYNKNITGRNSNNRKVFYNKDNILNKKKNSQNEKFITNYFHKQNNSLYFLGKSNNKLADDKKYINNIYNIPISSIKKVGNHILHNISLSNKTFNFTYYLYGISIIT